MGERELFFVIQIVSLNYPKNHKNVQQSRLRDIRISKNIQQAAHSQAIHQYQKIVWKETVSF